MTASGGTELLEKAWERGSIPLKFQVGDLVLGQTTLSLYRRSALLGPAKTSRCDPVHPAAISAVFRLAHWDVLCGGGALSGERKTGFFNARKNEGVTPPLDNPSNRPATAAVLKKMIF